ncbi:MAG: anaerobic glycerol-3-phosphate dehydrogenase subunit GlpB [Bacillota bacterium]
MNYDVVIIGAGLAGLSSALAVIKKRLKAIIISKGLGNLYSSSGYVGLLGYYPLNYTCPVLSPKAALKKLITEKPEHPYAMVGQDFIEEALSVFLQTTRDMGLPYSGTLDENILLPTTVGGLLPTTLFPDTSAKEIGKAEEIIVLGIEELIDFCPQYAADNLKKRINVKIFALWESLRINYYREINSYDLALLMEREEIRECFIKRLKPRIRKGSLILIPAVLGITNWCKIISHFENTLGCSVLEIPTLPPSVMGYRLAEALKGYLKQNGVEFLIGSPVTDYTCKKGSISEIFINSINNRQMKIKGKSYVLATGGILGGGLRVYPKEIKESIFGLPVFKNLPVSHKNFFNLNGQPFAYSGIAVNNSLQPINLGKGEVVFNNLYIAGALLSGYDPFVEKNGNGVALVSGYKAGLQAAAGGGAQ